MNHQQDAARAVVCMTIHNPESRDVADLWHAVSAWQARMAIYLDSDFAPTPEATAPEHWAALVHQAWLDLIVDGAGGGDDVARRVIATHFWPAVIRETVLDLAAEIAGRILALEHVQDTIQAVADALATFEACDTSLMIQN